jgi:hypothetical protein
VKYRKEREVEEERKHCEGKGVMQRRKCEGREGSE